MNNIPESSGNTSKGNRKTIQINQEFFKIGKKGNAPITGSRKIRPKNKPIANNTIKQALAKRVQERKQKDLDDIYQRRTSATAPAPMQTELSKSLSYLSEFVKNKKKKNDPAKRKIIKTTMKAYREPIVNLELPDELMTNILPAPMGSLVQPTFPIHVPNVVKPPAPAAIPVETGIKYTYSTVAPPYSNLKNSSGDKPTYRVWNHTRKRGGGHAQQVKTPVPIKIPAPLVFNTPMVTPKISERESKLASIKNAVAVRTPTPAPIVANPVAIPTAIPTAIPIATSRTIKRTITNKYTVGRKIGGRKVSVLIKNLKTRRKIQEAKKELKKTGTADIKKYLKSHGLLKVGSVAPNNVLREMYESAMMSGEIQNTNGQVALHNFNADDD
jgi:hypothetical protein